MLNNFEDDLEIEDLDKEVTDVKVTAKIAVELNLIKAQSTKLLHAETQRKSMMKLDL